MTQEDFNEEVQSYINEVALFARRVKYFAQKRQLWMKKYNEKCQEITELKKRLAQYE